jgi:hypothetical protein
MSIELILSGDLLIVVEREDAPAVEAIRIAPDPRAIGEAELADWVCLRGATA